MKNIILWTWCLPQTLVGLIVKLIFKGKKLDETYYRFDSKLGSISLGKYILLCEEHVNDERVRKHEYGHQLQSYLLGWLYLPVIALPSLIWAGCFNNYRLKHGVSYYDFYTEKWANKLGGCDE